MLSFIHIAVLAAAPVAAKDVLGPTAFCALYTTSPFCEAGGVTCQMCHGQQGAPELNPYGLDVQGLLVRSTGDDAEWFPPALTAALVAAEGTDSDGDGPSNLDEILGGSWPGFTEDVDPECSEQGPGTNPWYEVGAYDGAFAYRRVSLDFCGVAPTYEELQAVRVADAADQAAAIQQKLAGCLDSAHWASVLEELSLPVVVPIPEKSPLELSLRGDPYYDMRLFAYALQDGRDAGLLMTADFYVMPDGSVAYEDVTNQPLEREHRYGLITSRYSLSRLVMEQEMPRQLSAHYMRRLLGLDIASDPAALFPLPADYPFEEPRDVDGKRVGQAECAYCHTTLDPLTYPWARYWGQEGSAIDGTYDPTRYDEMIPTEDGAIFGQTIYGPEEWVQAAVTSDTFAQQVVRIFWSHLVRHAPLSCDEDEFEALWTAFRDGGRDVEAMLSALVTTEAYGRP